MGPAVREVKAGEVTKFVKKPRLAAVGAFASKDSSEYSLPSSPVVSPQPQAETPNRKALSPRQVTSTRPAADRLASVDTPL